MKSNNPITITDTSDQFLDTAFRLKMKQPVSIYMYMDMYDKNEENKEISTLSMKLFSKSIATEPRSVTGVIQQATLEHLSKNFGVDAKLDLVSQLIEEDLGVLQMRLHNLYVELGRKNVGKRTRWQSFAEKKLKVSMPIYTSSVIKSILMLSNYILKTSRKGHCDLVVLSRNLATHIQDYPGFVHLPVPVSKSFKIIELIGSFNNILVFINHNLPIDDFTVTVGRKTDAQEPGVLIAEHAKAVYDVVNPDFSTKCIISSEDAVVSAGFKPSTNYYSREIVIGKAPLWKRILQLVPTL